MLEKTLKSYRDTPNVQTENKLNSIVAPKNLPHLYKNPQISKEIVTKFFGPQIIKHFTETKATEVQLFWALYQ